VGRLGGRFYRINEREPVHPDNRNVCEALGWTMSHDLKENLDFLKKYKETKPSREILNNYVAVCRMHSDINQLLPTIFNYAKQSETIVEMGVRDVVSTWAFLAASPKRMRSYDIEQSPNIEHAKELATGAGIDFEFSKQDVLEESFEIEEADLVFIDTWHRYDQLKKELSKHGNRAKKFLIFHDTETFGFKDEEETDFRKQPQGLRPAIEEFLEENPHWKEVERLLINNGLTVLKREENGREV
jgi:predicted O-methyltransferase YrrM